MQNMLQNREYVQQTLSIYGAFSDGIKKHSFRVSPTAITTNVADLSKTNPQDVKDIEVKVTGTDGKVSTFKIGQLDKNSKADVVKPDDKKDEPEPPAPKPITPQKKGMGVQGWVLIILFLGLLVGGAWWFVRREQLKSQAREKMIEGEVPEMESYA